MLLIKCMDYLTIANAPVFWGLCGITVAISFAQALLFMRQASKTSAQVGLEAELPGKAFKIGLISAIGPACGVFIVMVGLMASIGGPMAWLRLSIIGAAATELSAFSVYENAARRVTLVEFVKDNLLLVTTVFAVLSLLIILVILRLLMKAKKALEQAETANAAKTEFAMDNDNNRTVIF
ncbi:DUF5058 family protein [Clostridium sp. AF32-12BH]|nr:DUF5058 family protein [Clostridium sp. AF32-12BH]RHP45346.1 DUF5058 family protein [Clostridium sp. AF32-12BH]